MPPNAYSLVSVSARPATRTIDVVFASASKRILKNFPFFPSFYLPRTSTTMFEKLLHAQPAQPRYQVAEHAHSIQVMTGTWEDLKQVAQRLYAQTGYFPSLIEPERQFLLTQKWKYFQAFDEKQNPLPETFLDAPIPGLAENMHPTLLALRKHAPEIGKNIIKRMAASHELAIPYTDVPLTIGEQVEVFLTNSLFAQHVPAPHEKGKTVNTENWSGEQRIQAAALAFNTPLLEGEGKCACCTPTSIFHQNVHTGSLIESMATQDGVYIHTHNKELSTNYHEKNKEKEKRIAHAKEWGLSTFPIGPLYRGEKIILPLRDAIEGQRQGILMASQPPTAATWVCRKEPFTLEGVRTQLAQRMNTHASMHAQLVQPYLTQYQLAYTIHADQNPCIGMHQASEKMIREWANALPVHLLRGETAWRSPQYTTLIQAGI